MTSRSGFRRIAEVGSHLAILAILAAALLIGRSGLARSTSPGAATDAAADELPGLAAAALEAATAPGGDGITFEILQRSTIVAKPDGPRIDIPDPGNRHGSLGRADSYLVSTSIERGAVTPEGFWMEIRQGPAADAKPDWTAPYAFGAIVRDGVTWRNDGKGWYRTDQPPGIGLDPATAALLPRLLRNSQHVTEIDPKQVDGRSARTVKATGKVADIPGVIAAGGLAFTELRGSIEYSFDPDGRLLEAHFVARNTKLETFDLVVDTVIDFAYPAQAHSIPAPSPVLPAAAK